MKKLNFSFVSFSKIIIFLMLINLPYIAAAQEEPFQEEAQKCEIQTETEENAPPQMPDEKQNERTSTQAFEVSFFRRIHTPHIHLYCDASVGVCEPTLMNQNKKPRKNTKTDSFIGGDIFSLDFGYLGTGIKNNGWGAGLRWEVELFRYFSIKPGFSHMTMFPSKLDYHIITVGIEIEMLFYPFGRGLDWLYLGIGQGCDFIMYTGGNIPGGKDRDSAISVFPEIGWKQNFLDYVMVDVFASYQMYLNENEFQPAAKDILKKGFQYGLRISLNLKRIWQLRSKKNKKEQAENDRKTF